MTDLKHLVRRLRSPPDVQMATRVALLLLLGELVLCGLIIWRVPCERDEPASLPHPRTNSFAAWPRLTLESLLADTEIDWEAYMQQSALFTKVRTPCTLFHPEDSHLAVFVLTQCRFVKHCLV